MSATIRITAKGYYIILKNDRDLLAVCKDLSSALILARGYRVSFGWSE